MNNMTAISHGGDDNDDTHHNGNKRVNINM